MEGYLISVVIPHYNTYELLYRCLSSIPQRKDIQIIVVDDHSPNLHNLYNTIEEFKQVELVVLPINSGAGRARNEGLKIAKGKWIIFSDADDYFTEGAFDVFLRHINDTQDIIYYKVISKGSDNKTIESRDTKYNGLIDNYILKRPHSEDQLKYRYYVPWGKMVKNEFIRKHNISFEEIRYSNDVLFGLMSANLASSISAYCEIVYCVTNRKDSLTKDISEKAFMCRYEAAVRHNIFLKEIKASRYGAILFRYFLKSFRYGLPCTKKVLRIALESKVNLFAGISKLFI